QDVLVAHEDENIVRGRDRHFALYFFFSSRRLHTRSVSAFLLNRSTDLNGNPNELNQDDARYGFRCCHLKNIWTAPLPPETELSRSEERRVGKECRSRRLSCSKNKNNYIYTR